MNSPNYSMKKGSNNKKMTSFSHIKRHKSRKSVYKNKKIITQFIEIAWNFKNKVCMAACAIIHRNINS